jgi:glycerol-3-phosphate O-acyltransferase
MILHFFLERSLVSVALLANPAAPLPRDVVRDRVQKLSRLFKHEFRFRADAPFAEIFAETIERMRAASELVIDSEGRIDAGPGRLGWNGREWLLTYAAFLRNFLEAYRIAARGLGALLKGPMPEKDLIKKTLHTGKRMFFTGEVERPEAVSQPTLKNALAALVDHGIIRADGGKIELVTATPEAVKAAEALVFSYFDREAPE